MGLSESSEGQYADRGGQMVKKPWPRPRDNLGLAFNVKFCPFINIKHGMALCFATVTCKITII